MSADLWLVTLHTATSERRLAGRETHIDPGDTDRLREVLVDMVTQHTGTARVDLAQYRIQIRKPGSWVWGWCGVDPSGRTVVSR